MKLVCADLPRPNLAEEDGYGGGGGRRLRRRGSEDFRGRREYGGNEAEAVKLFLTSDDDVAVALGFEKLELGQRSSGVKEVRKGEGVFIATVKNGSPEEIGRTCP